MAAACRRALIPIQGKSRVSGAPPWSNPSSPRPLHTDPQRTPAFHDLLQFHLQGLDGSRWVVTGRTLDPMNGEFPISHSGDVVILEEDDAVGVFNDGAGAREMSQMASALDREEMAVPASQVWVHIRSIGGHFRKKRDIIL